MGPPAASDWGQFFVGRASELDMVAGMVDRLARGHGTIAAVVGEAGIGKSRLLERVLAAAPAAVTILDGACDELEQERPFGVLAQLADGIARTSIAGSPEAEALLAALRPSRSGLADLGPGGLLAAPELRYAVADGFVSALGVLAVQSPVLLVVEDVHWADSASVQVLHRVAKETPTRRRRVGVLMTCRAMELPDGIRRLLSRAAPPAGMRVDLGPLSGAAVRELVADFCGGEPGPQLLAHVATAAGNPLFVGEIVAALSEDNLLSRMGEVVEAAATAIPPRLVSTIVRRLSHLSTDTIEVLRIAAVLGSSFAVRDLTLVSAHPLPWLLAALREALAAGALAGDGEALSFRHDLVRTAVYEDMPSAMRRALHYHAGKVLAEAGAPADAVATQLGLGAPPGDRLAIEWFGRAAAAAALSAPAVAADLLERSLQLASGTCPDQLPIKAALSQLRVAAGRLTDGEALAREALAEDAGNELAAPSVTGLQATIALAASLYLQARFDESVDPILAAAADPRLPQRQRARLRALALDARGKAGLDNDAAELEAVAEIGRCTNDPVVSYYSVFAKIHAALDDGRFRDAADLSELAGDWATRVGRDRTMIFDPLPPVRPYVEADRFETARRVLDTDLTWTSRRGGAPPSVRHQHLGRMHWATARWDEARREGETSLGLAAAGGTAWGVDEVRVMLGLLELQSDDIAAAERHLSGFADTNRYETDAETLLLRLLLAEAHSDESELLRLGTRLASILGTVPPLSLRNAAGSLVLLAWRTPELGLLEALDERLGELARRAAVDSLSAVEEQCRGLLHSDPDMLLHAVELLRSTPRLIDRAAACMCGAGQGVPQSTRVELLREALAIYEAAGARREAARARAQLRVLGVRAGGRARPLRPRIGWDSLTPAEVQVAELVANGLTYSEIGTRLFVSTRTVESHVAHAFAKLGISRRSELHNIVVGERQRRAGIF